MAGCAPAPAELDASWLGPDPARAHALRSAPSVQAGRSRRTQVLVVGAGVAGLTAARQMRRRGIDVAVLEWDLQAGGNAQGGVVQGQPCPLGAHYLPQPGPSLPELQDLLIELGAAERGLGGWQAREAWQVHAPAERLYDQGAWHAGLLPIPGDSKTSTEYRLFAAQVREAMRQGFVLPTHRAPFQAMHASLDATTFSVWLSAQGLLDPGLRWYLDYCCRDDYGAGADEVSAWAGLQYFASRHGFHVPGDPGDDDDSQASQPPVLTAPDGNAWLVRGLSAPLADAIHLQRLVWRVDEERHGVVAQVLGPDGAETWHARHLVMATPLFVAQRLLRGPHAALKSVQLARAPWLVANLALSAPLANRLGAPPAWDNVMRDSPTLGYVNARHQTLDPRPGPQVLTLYWALPAAERARLLQDSARTWAQRVIDTLRPTHPDLPEHLQAVRLTRWGHAMAVPRPGVRREVAKGALAALRQSGGRVRFAHADLAGYSVFEEAFYAGWQAAEALIG